MYRLYKGKVIIKAQFYEFINEKNIKNYIIFTGSEDIIYFSLLK